MLQLESLKPAPDSEAAGPAAAFDAAPPQPRIPLLPVSMPHVDVAAAMAMRSRPLAAAAAAAPAGAVGGHPAAAIAAAVQARLSNALLGSPLDAGSCAGASQHEHADLAGAYGFGNLVLSKPLAGREGLSGAAAQSDSGGVTSAAMATLESLGARFSGSASEALGGVSAMQEHLGSVLAQQGVFPSSLFSSAFGKS